MSDLIAVGFQGEDTADQVLNKLQALQKEYLIDLEDSCIVVRDQSGRVHLKRRQIFEPLAQSGIGRARFKSQGAAGPFGHFDRSPTAASR